MTTLTIPLSCRLNEGVGAITRETRHADVTSFKVRDGFVCVEYEKPSLWDRFRALHGPRPGGRGFQKQWERKWEQFQQDHEQGRL